MRQYRPTIEELKKRYSMELARKRMARLRQEKRPAGEKVVRTPDNSEPWLPHPPRSVAECMWINEQIRSKIITEGLMSAESMALADKLSDEEKCRWVASRAIHAKHERQNIPNSRCGM